ncbi:MAG: FG-GAP-like repeat-containing protein [Ghiorsea sp.]
MRFLILFISLALVSCGNETPQVVNNNNTTAIQISFGSNIATGALLGAGNIPTNIEVIRVQAFAASGAQLTPAATSTKPNFNLTLTVPNGKGITIRATGFNAAKVKVYEGESAPLILLGSPQTVPITLSLSINLSANTLTTPRGGTVALTGSIAGIPPTASSPLLWSSTVGALSVTPATNGESASWSAPATIGSYTIGAKVDPSFNSDQDPNAIGTIDIDVINQVPVTVADTATTNAFAPVLINVLANDSDPDGDTLTLQAATKPTNGTTAIIGAQVRYTPDNGFAGIDTFTYGISDGFGGKKTDSVSVTVNAIPVNVSVTDSYSNANPVSGSNVTFTVTVTGDASIAIPSLLIASSLPAGLSPASNTLSQGTITNGKWNTGPIAAGATATLNLVATVQPNNGGVNITHSASLQAITPGYIDSIPADNSATVTIQPIASADVGINMTTSGSTAPDGISTMTYTLTAGNIGPDTASTVVITDNLPTGVTYVSNTGGVTVTVTGNFVTWNAGTLTKNATKSISVNATINVQPAGNAISNIASVTAAQPDLNMSNNSASTSFNTADIIAPVITLNGLATIIVQQNAVFSDPGTNVTDNIDVGLNTLASPFNSSTLGTYTITYTVSDSSGNAAIPVTRTVIVNNRPLAGKSSTSFQQGVAGYFGTQDTELRMDIPDANYEAGTIITADGATSPSAAGLDTRTLMRFDNIFGSVPGQIDPYATISAASLQLYMSSGGNDVDMLQMLGTWNQVSATWNSHSANVSGGNLLRTLPGRVVATVNDGTLLGTSATSPIIDVTPELKTWVNTPASNFGWGLMPTNTSSTDGVDFASSETGISTRRPKLTVDYLATQMAFKTAINTNITLTLDGADIDGNPLTTKITSLPINGTLYQTSNGTITTGIIVNSALPATVSNINKQVIFVPSVAFQGQASFTYVVNDGIEDSTPSAVSIHVDNVAPTIAVTTPGLATVLLNGTYIDAGATASDNVDGIITGNIVTHNPVNTAIAGTYTVTYDVTDAAGNIAIQATRTVKVNAAPLAGVTILSFKQGINGYAGGEDAQLSQATPTTPNAHDPITENISIDGLNGVGNTIGLMKFGSIFGAGSNQIPSGSNILQAKLDVYLSSGGHHVDMKQMNAAWTQNTATWNNDYTAAAASPQLRRLVGRPILGTPLDISTTYPTFDVYTELQNWSSGTANNGWAFLPFTTDASDGVDFGDSERINIAKRPQLNVIFQNSVTAVSVFSNTNIAYTLGGYDANGDVLTSIITTLPLAGTLYETPDGATLGTIISNVPTPVGSGQVIYVSSTPATPGPDSFQYIVHDGTSASAPATVNIVPDASSYVFLTKDYYAAPSDNTSIITVTAHLLDTYATAINSGTVWFSTTSLNANLSAPSGLTDVYGNVSITLTNAVIETVQIDAYATGSPTTSITSVFHSSSADPDSDGLTNLGEYTNNTDPFNRDTDGDGFSDGVEVTAGTNPLLIGNTPTLLATAVNSTNSITNNPSSISIHDVNQDGYSDVLLGDFGGSLYVYPGNGSGSIAGLNPTPIASGASSMQQFDVGFINGDAYSDIVMPSETLDSVFVLVGNGVGGYTLTSYSVDLYASPRSAAIGDINNDSFADIVTANYGTLSNGTTMSILNGNGAGFTLAAPITLNAGDNGMYSIASSDFNQDGYAGIAVSRWGLGSGTTLTVLGNTANTISQVSYTVGQAPSHVQIGDLNADGYADLVSCSASSSAVSILFGDGVGGFSAPSSHNLTSGGQAKWSAIGDIDGDGFEDIVVAESVTQTVAILKGNGVGGFSPPLSYAVAGATNPSSIALADMNGDGKLDVVVANFNSFNVSVLLNTGP